VAGLARVDPWVTAYALWGSTRRRRRGDPCRRRRSTAPCNGCVGDSRSWRRVAGGPGRSRARRRRPGHDGRPDPGFTNRLYERRAEMPLFARALLATPSPSGRWTRRRPRSCFATWSSTSASRRSRPRWSRTSATTTRPCSIRSRERRRSSSARWWRSIPGTRSRRGWRAGSRGAQERAVVVDARGGVVAPGARRLPARVRERAPSFDRGYGSRAARARGAVPGQGALQRDVTVPMAKVLGQDPTVAFQMDGSGRSSTRRGCGMRARSRRTTSSTAASSCESCSAR